MKSVSFLLFLDIGGRRSRWRRHLIGAANALLLATVLLASQTSAAPQHIEDFGAGTWSRLLAEVKRPAVVVFSTTYCAVCPEAMKSLAGAIQTRRTQAPLIAVVMDGAGQNGLLTDPHYALADRLFVFRGQEAALRHSVNTRWRGVTPFVVLLAKDRAPVFITGVPAALELEAWAPTQ